MVFTEPLFTKCTITQSFLAYISYIKISFSNLTKIVENMGKMLCTPLNKAWLKLISMQLGISH
jgi:hypothetical protein